MVATSSSAESISDTVSSPSNVLSSIARTLKHRMDPDVVVGMKVTDPSVIVISEESLCEGIIRLASHIIIHHMMIGGLNICIKGIFIVAVYM